MYLDDRKIKILQAIIDDYINTAEPVGSRTVSRKYELGLSSATIRNEMADLEEMGFLEQPHTSAGRVPSDRGYRLYVDRLMILQQLTAAEVESIKHSMETRIHEINELIKQASQVMSRITRYTAIATAPEFNKSSIKAIQLVLIEHGKIFVVIVTNAGAVRNNTAIVNTVVTPEFLNRMSFILTDKLQGLTIEEINLPLIEEIKREMGDNKEILSYVLESIADSISAIDGEHEVYLGGTANIFNFPEYNDISRAREFLSFLETRDSLLKLLKESSGDKSVNISIGKENKVDEARDCTLVTATYSCGGRVIGKVGVIGPTRMHYSRVISSLEYVRNVINEEIIKLLGEK